MIHDLADADNPGFDPYRFLDRADGKKDDSLSFSYGEYACIGQYMGMFIMTGIMSELATGFDLKALAGEVGDLSDSVVARPAKPLWAELSVRVPPPR